MSLLYCAGATAAQAETAPRAPVVDSYIAALFALERHEIAALGLTLGILAFAVVTAILLLRTRERGYSIDDIENEDGIRCAGAPVFDHTGRVQAGISVAGPASRMTVGRLHELGPEVRAQADLVSERLGFGMATA